MEEQQLLNYREVLGQGLCDLRKGKGISTYQIRQKQNLNAETINQIETGSAAYTINSLLKYLQAIDVYVFFADKKGKEDVPLDVKHMRKAVRNSDPKL
jgi:transcriptional regulator with XRE-family HTH domain